MTSDWLIEILSIKVPLRIREQHPSGKFLTNPQREGLKPTMVSVSPSTKHKLSNTLATLANFFIYASPIILLLPSRELTCPFPNHFWRWFSFSKGEIWYVTSLLDSNPNDPPTILLLQHEDVTEKNHLAFYSLLNIYFCQFVHGFVNTYSMFTIYVYIRFGNFKDLLAEF